MTDKEQIINNFAKDINVPCKEPIMIDGVDISGCLFYQSNFEEDYDVRIKHFCSNWHNSCESSNNSNCYYKQLARKTQECEKWKHQAELGSDTTDRLSKQLEEKEQECEKIKSEATELFNAKLELLRELDHYKRAYYGCAKRIKECLVLPAPLPPAEIVDDRYRKALEEIEKVLSHCIMTGAIVKILTIINKAKGEGKCQ